MEPKPDESSKLHVLKKILYDKDNKSSSSSSSGDKTAESQKTSAEATEKSCSEDNVERPASRNSPEPNCAICLEPLQNKSFTDSCFHTFCFTCLVEWSKVKAECPLCKQQFKSIVHNVKKDLTFEEYFIGSRTSKFLTYYRTEQQQRFRYPTTMTASRVLERNRASIQESYQSQIASHRMRFAPHSVNVYSNAQIMTRMPCAFRLRVYQQNLWVKTSQGGRTRVATPEFYRRNPACTHRLIPWLNRELVSLWQDNEAQVTFILELIMSLVVRYHINSQEFLIHIEPYMGKNTHHFVHEFYAFAISPFDMENYDAHADYGLMPPSAGNPEPASPDSDVIAVFPDENTPSLPSPYRKRKQNMRQQALKHLRMILRKSSGNSWESYISPASSSFISPSWSNPGPSTSGFRANNYLIDGSNTNFTTISDIEQSDDDIQVVNVVKPRAERTPEIVDLSSDEEKPVVLINVSSDEENFSPVCSPLTPPLTANSGNDLSSSDIECLSEIPSTSREVPTMAEETSTEKDAKAEEQKPKDLHHNSSATEDLESDVSTEVKKAPKLASAIVRPWTTESESSRKAWVPSRIKRRFSSSCLDDSSSDSSDSEKKTSSRKLKLRSVIAHFSYDHSSDYKYESSHRSSHKKHKEKKKRRKHAHRRKQHIYSDSDSA